MSFVVIICVGLGFTNTVHVVQVDEEQRVTLIDFPQMVSTRHANAAELFYRDVDCIGRFFRKKLGYMPEHDASLPCARPDFQACGPLYVMHAA